MALGIGLLTALLVPPALLLFSLFGIGVLFGPMGVVLPLTVVLYELSRAGWRAPDEIRLAVQDDSPGTALNGRPRFVRNGALTPDFWAINTLSPPFQPSTSQDPTRPDYADPNSPNTLPPQTHRHIGDALDAKGVDWAWYAGGWALAVQGNRRHPGGAAQQPVGEDRRVHHLRRERRL
ncbi:hypothetical protein NB693_25175 [Pantoea ananatis]|uniref:alkaline phosphatase family protein n=1 Tax=Pantoea ananas TaxID=553 RepID=UPI00221F3811|nr:hypothetical protein [Pantoea ananatis]